MSLKNSRYTYDQGSRCHGRRIRFIGLLGAESTDARGHDTPVVMPAVDTDCVSAVLSAFREPSPVMPLASRWSDLVGVDDEETDIYCNCFWFLYCICKCKRRKLESVIFYYFYVL